MSTTLVPVTPNQTAGTPTAAHEDPAKVVADPTTIADSPKLKTRDAEKLNDQSSHQSSQSLAEIRAEVQHFRFKQRCLAYSVMVVSIFCTLGTAFIGVAAAVLSFDSQSIASKAVSLTLAAFGVILSLLKGTGQPANAFLNIIAANNIMDDIDDFNDPPSTKKPNDIKGAWRQLRNSNIANKASVWKNLQK